MANLTSMLMNFYGKPEDLKKAFTILNRDKMDKPYASEFFDFTEGNKPRNFENGNRSLVCEASAKWLAVKTCSRACKKTDLALTLPEICKLTHVSCEFFSAEEGQGIQEHGVIKADGTIPLFEARPYNPHYTSDMNNYDGFNWEFTSRDVSKCRKQNGPEFDSYMGTFDINDEKYQPDPAIKDVTEDSIIYDEPTKNKTFDKADNFEQMRFDGFDVSDKTENKKTTKRRLPDVPVTHDGFDGPKGPNEGNKGAYYTERVGGKDTIFADSYGYDAQDEDWELD